jgi:glycosyltransferase involved in cell wall biosynthesis
LGADQQFEERGEDRRIVAQVCPRYHPYIGGVETHVKEISERLAKRNFGVEVLTTDPKGDLPRCEEIGGVTVRRFRSWAPSEAYYFSGALSSYLGENASRYDLIHAHSYHAFPSLYAARNKGKTRLFFTPHYHGEGHSFLRKLLLKPYRVLGAGIFRNAEKVVSVSEYEKGLILRDFDIPAPKIEVIPNGVNKEEFVGLKRGEKAHRTILSVGRLEEYKGMQDLVGVLPELEGDVRLDIVGRGPYADQLSDLVKSLGLTGRVEIVGGIERSELLQRYVDADLFALLSHNEAYGITVAEALAAGTPCIVAKASALSEWVDDKNCFGLDVPIDRLKLKQLIGVVMGKVVSDVVLLDWDDVTERLIKIYLN